MTPGLPYRLAAVTSHPVQYQAPLFRQLAAHECIDLTVFYGDDRSVAGELDHDFGVRVQWDRPLLDGYRSIFLTRRAGAQGAIRRLAAEAGIVRYLWRGRFDAVFIHSYATRLSILAYLGALASRTPVLLRTESERLRPRRRSIEVLKELLLRPLLAVTAGVMVIGEANRKFYDYYGVGRNRQFFTPYSVDNDYFLSQRRLLEASRHERRLARGWADDITVVGFSGKLIPRKGADVLIDAVANLQDEGLRVGLLLIGEGRERPALEERGRARGLKWTVFAGFKDQSELAAYYTCADMFVLPSRFDSWGLVVNEAMVFGLPVLATTMVGASLDLIEQGANGYVYDVRDVHGLTGALRTLATRPEMRREFGRRSESIVQHYSYDACVRGILEGLHHVTGRACAPADAAARGEAET